MTESKFNSLIKWISLFVVIGVCSAIFIYMYQFKGYSLGGTTAFGEFGDYIGGILNPILGFATVILLISSIRIQMKELRESTKALQKSQTAHEEQVKISKQELEELSRNHTAQQGSLRKESRCKQLTEQAERILTIYDALMAKPYVQISSNPRSLIYLLEGAPYTSSMDVDFDHNEILLSITEIPDIIKSTASNLLDQQKSLHLMAVQDNLRLLAFTVIDLIPMLEITSLQEFWHLQTKQRIADCFGIKIITEEECDKLLKTLRDRKTRSLV